MTFKDINGVEWAVRIDLATARKVRDRMKTVETLKDFDFLDCAAIALALETDVFFAADLLYEVCRDEAQARGVDAAAFGAALRGRALFDAVAALTAEYLNFFPDPTTVEKARAALAKSAEARAARIDAICFGATKALEGAAAAAESAFGVRSSSAAPFSESASGASTT